MLSLTLPRSPLILSTLVNTSLADERAARVVKCPVRSTRTPPHRQPLQRLSAGFQTSRRPRRWPAREMMASMGQA